MNFPPIPVFPKRIDSDYTLFVVFNTTETRLSANNFAWAQEISIVPVKEDENEIWADNGYGNIEGELFYYDSVEKNEHNKVIKLKGCIRQIGGEKTKYNKRGTWIRSYVVAEHHNQLSNCIMKIEDFVGRNFDTRLETLDWRIRNLQDLDIIFDDFSCPDVNFTFNIIENSQTTGILAEYLIEITPPGSISSFRLDFGDGEFTTSNLSGQHRYALNARIDPVVKVSNDKCQLVQTPITRTNPAEPPLDIRNDFNIPIPEIPDIPDFTFVPCEIPEPELNIPPLVTPCISLASQVIPGISIVGPNINLVSQVTINSPNPINIPNSIIRIDGNIPSLIILDPPIPPTIVIDPPIPPTIILLPPFSSIALELDMGALPKLEVDWGSPPEMEVALTMAKEVKTPERFAADPEIVNQFGEEFADLFTASNSMKVEYESVGIPSEIKVVYDEEMKLKIDSEELKNIKLQVSDINIPTDIKIHGPDSPIPNFIRFDNVPESFELIYKGEGIPVDGASLPKSINIEMEKDIPNKIIVEIPKPIPEKLVIEHNIPSKIALDGPVSIPLTLPENFFLPVKFPDVMPQVEMVYKGSPIELKVSMDEVVSKDAEGKQCFMLVPCK